MSLPTEPSTLDAGRCPRFALAGGFCHYLAAWDHGFFGFFDGAVAQFKVATAPLDAAGQFQVEIPDFSKDAVTTQKIDAYLDVLVVSRSSGNIVQMVAPAGEWRHQNLGLKILSRYD